MNLSRRRPGSVHINAPSFPTISQPSVYRRIAYTFIALTVVIVLAVLWLTSVKAEVLVKVKRDRVRLDGVVEVAKEPKTGQIPGRVVQGVYEKVQEFPVLGAAGEPVDPSKLPSPTPAPTPVPTPSPVVSESVIAKGTVRIVNKYSKSQTLVKTTRLLTSDNKLYRIDAQVVVPPGGTVSVGAYADKPGSQFVLSGPQKFTIPGLFVDIQQYIYAESDAAFQAVPVSSVEATKPVTPPPAPSTAPTTKPKAGKPVTQADLDRAEKTLTDTVLNQAMKSLAGEVGSTTNLEVVYVVKVVDRKFMVRPGDVAENFLASIKLDVTAVYYGKEDMQTLVRSRLRERVPAGREFLPFDSGAITYSLESSDIKAEIASIRVSADAAYRLSPSSPLLQKSVIAGKSKSEAESMLKAVDGVESVEIKIQPGWIDSIPSLKDRIDLKVE
ncbi:hypothetical protein K8R04_04775 [Candidatus Uhrbacteria bacterium]|nr:hypothetical protein [Candidatus Uhrbacteria bacterium]